MRKTFNMDDASVAAGHAAAVATTPATKCRICGCGLAESEGDDFERKVCNSCMSRPEARRLGIERATIQSRAPATGEPARQFTAAERSLIHKVHGYMPPEQLLAILNERLMCDLGPDAAPYTMEQLYTEIGDTPAVTAGQQDWAGLRKLLASAQRSGVLDKINEQIINDFAVVYSLNAKQVLTLKDIVLQAKED